MFKQRKMSRLHPGTFPWGKQWLTIQLSVHPCYEILMFMIITAANSLVMGLTSLMLQEESPTSVLSWTWCLLLRFTALHNSFKSRPTVYFQIHFDKVLKQKIHKSDFKHVGQLSLMCVCCSKQHDVQFCHHCVNLSHAASSQSPASVCLGHMWDINVALDVPQAHGLTKNLLANFSRTISCRFATSAARERWCPQLLCGICISNTTPPSSLLA